MLPHLAPLKTCAQMLSLRSVAELQNGQSEKAAEDVLLTLQLADKVHGENIVISHMVRAAMVQLVLQPVWEGLAAHEWSEAQLAAFELARLNFPADYERSLQSELGAQCDEMKFLRHHPEHIRDLEVLRDFDGVRTDVRFPSEWVLRLIPAGWFYQNQARSARMLQEHYFPLANPSVGTFSLEVARRGEAALAAELGSPGCFNISTRLMLPFLGNAARKIAYGQSSVNLARTAIALERYRMARGEFPETLAPLAPQFVAKVPVDVMGGQSLNYHRETGGGFTLYSVGWNGKDDHGLAAFKPDGSVDLQQGDWIWPSAAMPKR
jgi:hypothetical protein